MKATLLSGIAVAMAFVVQPVPTSANSPCAPGHPCPAHAHVGQGPAPAQYPAQAQHPHYGHAHGPGPGYGVAAGAAALAAGALIGGAIAAQGQDDYPAQAYPVYSGSRYGYSAVSGGDPSYDTRLCAKLRWTCDHKDELGLQGAGTCGRYRATCQ